MHAITFMWPPLILFDFTFSKFQKANAALMGHCSTIIRQYNSCWQALAMKSGFVSTLQQSEIKQETSTEKTILAKKKVMAIIILIMGMMPAISQQALTTLTYSTGSCKIEQITAFLLIAAAYFLRHSYMVYQIFSKQTSSHAQYLSKNKFPSYANQKDSY